MKTCLFSLIVLISGLKPLSAQYNKVILDTIYDKYLKWEDTYLFIGDQQASTLVKGELIVLFPAKVDRFRGGILGVPLVQVDNRCYLLNDELEWNPNKYVNVTLQSLSHGGQHLCVNSNKVSYVKGDSVFVADFDTHKADFVLEDVVVSNINKKYIWMQRDYPEEDYIYIFDTKKLLKLPSTFALPKTDHPYFLVNSSLDDKIHVINLDLKDVISPKEGYTDYYILGDLLILYGNRKPLIIYHKNKLLNLDEDFIDVECRETQNMCFLTNVLNKIAVLNPEGEMLSPAIFDASIYNTFYAKHSILRRGKMVQIYDRDFALIVEGEYDQMQYIYEDRILAESRGRSVIIDTNNSLIIPSSTMGNFSASAKNEYGPKLIKAYRASWNVLYDYDGAEIVRWEDQKEDQFLVSRDYMRGYNFRMIQSLRDDQEARINPSGVWIRREKIGKSNIYFACDRMGNKLSENFKRMSALKIPNQYLVRTMSDKLGILSITK